VLDDQTLSWKPGLPGSTYLLEDSADLQTWQEKDNGLTGTTLPLSPGPYAKRFFRVLGSSATTP